MLFVSEQWGEKASPITFPLTWSASDSYKFVGIHRSSQQHKIIPIYGAYDGMYQYFDLWNAEGGYYDSRTGEILWIAVGY